AGFGTRSDQQGTGIVRLFSLPRPARAASPYRWFRGAAEETGVLVPGRQEPPPHGDDPGVLTKNGRPDRRPPELFEDRTRRDQNVCGELGAACRGGRRGARAGGEGPRNCLENRAASGLLRGPFHDESGPR